MGCDSSKDLKVLPNHMDVNENGIEGTQEEVEAATKIQAAFRGHKERAKMKQGDGNHSDEHEQTKEELEAEFDLNDEELKGAAVKIQACFRGHVERKKLATDDAKKEEEDIDLDEITKKVAEELDIDVDDPELHKAATKIQATFRGHKTRKQFEDAQAN